MERNPKEEKTGGISRRELLKAAGLGGAAFALGMLNVKDAFSAIERNREKIGSVPKDHKISQEAEEIIPGPDWVAESIPGHPELDPVLDLLRDVGRHASDGSAAVWVGYDSKSSPPRAGEAAGAFYYAGAGENEDIGHIRLAFEEWIGLPDGLFRVTIYRFIRGAKAGYGYDRKMVGVVNKEFPGPRADVRKLLDQNITSLTPDERQDAETAYHKAIAVLAAADREKLRKLPLDFYYKKGGRQAPAGP